MGEDVGGWGSQGLSGFRPFSLDHFDDYQKHFTVMNYGEGVQLKQVHYDEFIPMFEKQYPWKVVEVSPILFLFPFCSRTRPPCLTSPSVPPGEPVICESGEVQVPSFYPLLSGLCHR
ncbi:uncharacterized protein isoform X1 [Salmo salar]|uniref:Uncharacterized protein isoform X1 n=1 Tax=Salmo salar TaxID=8030 RepID=A0ABM3F3R4_SALSA|nr:uncharacterized protein LOC106609317 isoform X1 [Salmo salar]